MKTLLGADEIAARVEALGREIRESYGDETITAIAVLKGSFMFLADLVRAIGGDVRVEFASTVEVAAVVRFLHPTHNFGLVQYDPKHIQGNQVVSATLSATPIACAPSPWLIPAPRSVPMVSRPATSGSAIGSRRSTAGQRQPISHRR